MTKWFYLPISLLPLACPSSQGPKDEANFYMISSWSSCDAPSQAESLFKQRESELNHPNCNQWIEQALCGLQSVLIFSAVFSAIFSAMLFRNSESKYDEHCSSQLSLWILNVFEQERPCKQSNTHWKSKVLSNNALFRINQIEQLSESYSRKEGTHWLKKRTEIVKQRL